MEAKLLDKTEGKYCFWFPVLDSSRTRGDNRKHFQFIWCSTIDDDSICKSTRGMFERTPRAQRTKKHRVCTVPKQHLCSDTSPWNTQAQAWQAVLQPSGTFPGGIKSTALPPQGRMKAKEICMITHVPKHKNPSLNYCNGPQLNLQSFLLQLLPPQLQSVGIRFFSLLFTKS